MENSCLLFALLVLWLLNNATPSLSTTIFDSSIDKQTLIAFKAFITSDPYAILGKNWTADTPVCDWISVSCGMKHRRVTALNLSEFGLAGTVAPHLGNLTFLRHLDISSNSFTGFLPSELSNLRRLKVMNFAANEFIGEIPVSLGSLPQLEELILKGNSLSGSLPSELCNNIPNLKILSLSDNQLSGEIPPKVWKCKNLELLELSTNYFSGKIPVEIGSLGMLKELYLGENYFTGGVPPEVGNLSSLQTLNIMNIPSLTGYIPSSIFNISSLKFLALDYTSLSGSIPTFHNLPQLEELYLSKNKLTGWLPSNMCSNIPNIKILHLGFNQLAGQIPPDIWKCTYLEILGLSFNKFRGNIPSSIFNMSSLKYLSLGGNYLSGSIPAYQNLPQLKELTLRDNNLTGGLPIDMCNNMPKINILYLHSNRLEGQIPSNIWKCIYLEMLALSNNSFTGNIPREIGNMSMLMGLSLSMNHFQGGVPPELGNLSGLETLDINDASLSGNIPPSIFNISSLEILVLPFNSLSGSIPTFHNLPRLKDLYLHNNNLTGEIPSSLCDLKSLKYLSLSNNSLEGSIPDCLENLSRSLKVLHLRENRFRGFIPTRFAKGCSLESVGFGGNKLAGALPQSLLNCQNLQVLDVGNNSIHGKFPFWMETLPQLRVLILRSNMFSGSVLSTLGTKLPFPKLQVFDISKNAFTGSLTPEYFKSLQEMIYRKENTTQDNMEFLLIYGDSLVITFKGLELSFERILPTFTMIDWSSNKFSGHIPNSVGNLLSLMHLNLSHNCLTGHIPESLGNLTQLESLDLSSNKLSANIPVQLAKLSFLAKFNVSMNNLSGQIPQGGQLSTFENSSYIGNSGLCGFPLTEKCEHPRPYVNNFGGTREKRVPEYVVPTLILVVVLVTVVVVLVMRIKRKKVQLQYNNVLQGFEYRRISFLELERGTSSFSETNLLGIGGFGSVFEATLFDGLKVAVKVFNLQLERAAESFHAETEILSNIRHRNLVRVISCCTSLDFKALILEYMPNGSLEKWLYSENLCLSFLQRLKVAMDVASALEYLHHGYTFPIVHCDIKPSNVLLDEDMTARVSDFGISKLFDQGDGFIHTKTLATVGYAAPEHGSEGKVSTNGDVYSYGILLLEIFTGKKPTNEMFNEEMNIKEWVNMSMQNNAIGDVVVPDLLSKRERYYNEKVKYVWDIFDLAMKCLSFSATERINMREVVATLNKIKAKFEL